MSNNKITLIVKVKREESLLSLQTIGFFWSPVHNKHMCISQELYKNQPLQQSL